MKFRMAERSLFAILLRSPWWISLAVAGAFVAAARALLPAEYFVVGALGAMPWSAFAAAIVDAFRRDGHAVAPHPRPPADFALTKNGRVVLIACKRWKAARTGVEPLRELRAVAAGVYGGERVRRDAQAQLRQAA